MDTTLPLLAFSFPLAGALLLILPWPSMAASIRRPAYLTGLGLTTVVLVAMAVRGRAPSVAIPSASLAFLGEPVVFVFDGVAVRFALLYTLPSVALSLTLNREQVRPEVMLLSLLLVVALLAAVSGTTLFALCLAWGLADMVLVGLGVIGRPPERLDHAHRQIWRNMAATGILAMATILAAVQGTSGSWGSDALARPVFLLLTLAVILRLGLYPLPGGIRYRGQRALFSLVSGGYLWIRLAPQAQDLGMGLLFAVGWSMVIAALIAALTPEGVAVEPYLLLHGSGILFLAPLLNPVGGQAVATITLVNLILSLTYAQLARASGSRLPWPHVGHWLLLLAPASLAGIPLTAGFISHLGLLRLCLIRNARMLLLLLALSLMLIAIPLWRALDRHLRHRWTAGRPASRHAWMTFGLLCLLALGMLWAGVYPGWFGGEQLSAWFGFSASALTGGEARISIWVGVLAALVPLIASYALFRLLGAGSRSTYHDLAGVGGLLELHWLYTLLEGALNWLGHQSESMFMAIERSLCLSWTLSWLMVLVLSLLRG